MRRDRPARVLGHLAEHVEVADPARAGVARDLRREALPERVVDVLHGVHPEAVDGEVADPALVDVDHPVHDGRVFGEQVVQPEEVAVLGVLPGEGRVAAVVVEADVVQPRRHLDVLLVGRHARVVAERGEVVRGRARRLAGRRERRERRAAGELPVVEHRAVGALVGPLVLRHVAHAGALLIPDDVRGVVGDDVEVDLDPARVGGLDQCREVVVGPQVRVDLREVGDPVAVVAG
jgi:hypothetical protein